MEFSKAGLTPASQATFGRSYGKKQKKTKTLKNDPRVMKQILYDMGKKNNFLMASPLIDLILLSERKWKWSPRVVPFPYLY